MATISGIFPNRMQAEVAIDRLKEAGVASTDISCIYTDRQGDVHDDQKGEKVGSGAVSGAATGAVIGTIAGLVVANGILPGIGTLFVAGPLAAALGFTGATATAVAGAATGAAAGGLLGALTQFGISEADAKLYEEHIKKGEVLVVCKADNAKVQHTFSSSGAQEVRHIA